MVKAVKQDSNITGLRYAVEQSMGVLPASPVWIPAEPNSYSDFGGDLTTVARNPINDSRQRKKGVVTDLDASGGYNTDITQLNLQELMQGFFFANFREKFDTRPFNGTPITILAVDAGDGEYQAVSGLDEVSAGSLVFASGFANAANNGLKTVVSSTATALVVEEAVVNESPPASARISHIGHVFDTGEVDIDVTTGSLPRLTVDAVAAASTLTMSDNFSNGEVVTIGDVTYTFRTSLTEGGDPNDVLLGTGGSALEDSLSNLAAAINGAAGEGTAYGNGTEEHPDVDATSDATTLTVTAKVAGEAGNAIVVTSDASNGDDFDEDGTLQGGSGKSLTDFGIIPGEWVFIGGDPNDTHFSADANNGFKRVKSVTGGYIEFDKSDLEMVTGDGTGLDIHLFFGRVLKNERGTEIVRRSFQWERTMGAPDLSEPNDIQAEYLVGSIPNQFSLQMQQADKLMADLSFVAIDHEPRDASQGLKTGSRPTLSEADAFNSTSDVAKIKLAKVVPGDESPEPLFAFAQELQISVNNNVTPNKAISRLGAFDVTAGTFEVSGSMTVYFADMAAVQAVRDNADITLDFQLVKQNSGIALDMPLLTLGDSRANIEQDQPITLPVSMDAATAASVDINMDHTLLMVFFDYLPTRA